MCDQERAMESAAPSLERWAGLSVLVATPVTVIASEELGAQEMPRVHLESCGLRHLPGGEHPPS